MAKANAPIVLIFGQDSLRADRALRSVLKARDVDPSEIIRLWGDEASFADAFSAAASRSLFSDKTVVVVRRAEKLKGGSSKDEDDVPEDGEDADVPEAVEEKPRGRRAGAKSAPPPPNSPNSTRPHP